MLTKGYLTLSTVSSLAFALHPVHVESVANIAHFAEMICASCFLLCQIFFMKSCKKSDETDIPTLLLSCVFYILSSLAKEIGLTAIGVTTLWSAVFLLPTLNSRRFNSAFTQFILRGLVLTAGLVVILAMRSNAAGNGSGTPRQYFFFEDNPAAYEDSLVVRTMSYMHCHSVQAGVLLWPYPARFDYSAPVITPVSVACLCKWLTVCRRFLPLPTPETARRYFCIQRLRSGQ